MALGMIIEFNLITGTRVDFVCLLGNEWVPTSFFGSTYLTLMSMSILTQINASQYITIRIPYTEKIFDTEQMTSLKKSLLLKRLQSTSVNGELSEAF